MGKFNNADATDSLYESYQNGFSDEDDTDQFSMAGDY